jgi:membrane associated rhomboid family serine protease
VRQGASLTDNGREREHEQLRREAEGFTGGPGVVATKSQARGSLAGILGGAIVGVLIGVVVGAIFFEGTRGIVITAVALAVAGATFGGVAGGFVGPRKKLKGTEADI